MRCRSVRFWIVSLLLLGCPWLQAGCGGEKSSEPPAPAPPAPAASRPAARTPDASLAADAASDAGDVPEPAPAPEAYFGDLGLDRVIDPVEVEPSEGSPVVLVVFDALTPKRLHLYGNDRRTSPNLDRLAREGLTLTHYFSNSSWTRPSFATIVTGQPKSVHGMELNCPPISEEIETLAERFAAAGYRAAGFVGNPLVQAKWGYGQGLDPYVDATELNHFGFADDKDLVRRAIRWIDEGGDEPFFLLLLLVSPHSPYKPPREFRRFGEGLPPGTPIRVPRREYRGGMDPGDLAWTKAAYDGEILYGDAQLGALLAHLKKRGLLEKTTIAVTADHGEAFGEHDCFQHTYHMWEPVLRVPFVVRSPAIPLEGSYDDRAFTHVDIAPTLLDLAGIGREDDELPGSSLVEALADPAAGRERLIFSQHDAHGIRREAIRDSRWKLVHHHPVDPAIITRLNELHPGRPTPDPRELPSVAWNEERWELYDMVGDPSERRNRFSELESAPATVALLSALSERIGETDEKSFELDEDLEELLEKLGYLGSPGGAKD